MIDFYWGSGSPYSWRVHQTLEHKGVPYESKLLSFSAREHKSPEFLAVNPRGKVPAIVHGDVVVYESNACVRYLDRVFPDPPVFGATPAEEAEIVCRVSEIDNYLDHAHGATFRPLFFGRPQGHEDAIRAGLPAFFAEIARWEAALEGKTFLVGERFSAADIALMPQVQNLLRTAAKPTSAPFDLGLLPLADRYPNLASWKTQIEAFDWFARTLPPHWSE